MSIEKQTEEQIANARLSIKQFISDINTEVMCHEPGPLTIEQLPDKVRMSDEFKETVALVGWPNNMQDKPVMPPTAFNTDNDFLNALRPLDGYSDIAGPRHITSSHFFNMLKVSPKYPPLDSAPVNSVYDMYGFYPVVHRAYIVAPEFFSGLKLVLDNISTQSPQVSENDEIYESLMNEQNKDVVAAMHVAYKLMLRLCKTDDSETITRLLGGSLAHKHASPVLIPEDLLLRGDTGHRL